LAITSKRGKMAYYLPIIGSVGLAVGTILEKIVLNKKRVDVKLYMTAAFSAIVVTMIPFLYFFWGLDPTALSGTNLFIFFLVVIFSIIANVLVFYSLKWEKLSALEPARVLEPLFVIILAIIFSFFVESLYDRNLNVIVPALISAGALIFSHVKKHHLEFNKYFIAAIVGSFFFALELVISRLILDFYTPITFYFLRSLLVLAFSFIIFRPNFKKLKTKTRWIIFATGAIWVSYRILMYYGYLQIGVIFTTLVLMIGPILIYVLAHFVLKEKIGWRNFVAAMIIVASILYALLSG
jgi:drug/metabolite transporter (DMT)-like permease